MLAIYRVKMHTFRQIMDEKGSLNAVPERKAYLQVLCILAFSRRMWINSKIKSVFRTCCRYESVSVYLMIMAERHMVRSKTLYGHFHSLQSYFSTPHMMLVLICIIVKFSAVALWVLSFSYRLGLDQYSIYFSSGLFFFSSRKNE